MKYLISLVNVRTGKGFIEEFRTAKAAKYAVDKWNVYMETALESGNDDVLCGSYLGSEESYYRKRKEDREAFEMVRNA
jgi:hypothetical protein